MLQCDVGTSAQPQFPMYQKCVPGPRLNFSRRPEAEEKRMKLWLGNIDPETTDDELRELVRKYTKLEISRVARKAGGGSRPGAVLEFDEGSADELYAVQRRLNGLHWKNRSLTAHAPLGR